MLDHTVSQPLRPPEETPDDTPLGKRLAAIVGRLEDEATRRVQRRAPVEKRWIADIQQMHGVYPEDVTGRMGDGQSRVFMNLTAPKTEAMKARLFDLLFPTDDRNWGIGPTPVPQLVKEADAALKRALEAKQAADQQQAAMQAAQEAGDEATAQAAEGAMREAEAVENEARDAADQLQEVLREARKRSDLMQEEIADQLAGCLYPSEARDMIDDACEIGCGVIKGPVIGERPRQRWAEVEVTDEAGTVTGTEQALVSGSEDAPAVYRVDPWGFFPDPDARRVQDGEGVFERHLMTKTKLKRLARRPDIDADAVRAILRAEPTGGKAPTYLTELASIKGGEAQTRDLYQVWEYAGPLDTEDMRVLAEAGEDDDTLAMLGESDPLAEAHAKVWFCQGRVLAFAIHPLDSGETVYSTYAIRRDASSPFGYGIPAIIRDAQSVVNGGYRMMMDNAGLATGPQVTVNKDAVTPQDGDDWALRPRKVWVRNGKAQTTGPAFEAFNIPSNQGDLASIIALGAQTIDETAAMPAIAQGEQGATTTQTFGGLALLMNSANVLFRRMVKDFDDDVTVPLIRRFYHWNMQFSQKAEIKGDYEVNARGASVLLVRELQANNLMNLAQVFGQDPEYGPMLRKRELLKQVVRTLMLSADEVLTTEREWEEWQASQEGQTDPALQVAQMEAEQAQAEMELRREEMSLKASLAQMERDWRMEVANLGHDATMMKLAEALNMKQADLEAKLGAQRIASESAERRLAVEVADKQRTGVGAGGAV